MAGFNVATKMRVPAGGHNHDRRPSRAALILGPSGYHDHGRSTALPPEGLAPPVPTDYHLRPTVKDTARTRTTFVRESPHAPGSHPAFLFHEIRGDQALYIRRMRERGILLGRPFPLLLEHNRLSLSAMPEELGRFVDTLRMFRKRG